MCGGGGGGGLKTHLCREYMWNKWSYISLGFVDNFHIYCQNNIVAMLNFVFKSSNNLCS